MVTEIRGDHIISFSIHAVFEQVGHDNFQGIPIIGYELFGLIVLSFALGLGEI